MKRGRNVFPTDEIPHWWAHALKTGKQSARNHGNLSFRVQNVKREKYTESVLVSYSTDIAMVKIVRGKTIALHLDESWSNTTSGHQSSARRATSHLPCFYVATFDNHKANLADYKQRIIDAAKAAKMARSHKEWKTNSLVALVKQANEYTTTFNLATRFSIPADCDVEKMIAEGRAAKIKENAAREITREKQQEQARKDTAEAIGKWIAGEPVYLPYIRNAYLRIIGDTVETSHGARVPIEHVKRAMPIVLRIIERGEIYQRNGHTIHLGDYAIDRIDADGTVVVGCHQFAKDEVVRFSKLLEA